LGLLAAALDGTTPRPRREPRAPRIGLVRTPWWDRVDEDGRAAVEEAAARCADGGAVVEDVALSMPLDDLLAAHWTILEVETAQALAPEYEIGADRLGTTLRAVIEGGREADRAEYDEAVRLAEQGKQRIDQVLTQWDALLTPVAPGEAPSAWSPPAMRCSAGCGRSSACRR